MDRFKIHRDRFFDWRPSAVVALAASPDGRRVSAAREDGSLELWLVSAGALGWHCQLTIHGSHRSRVSSLVWCRTRLLSSSIDGTVSEWDLSSLRQKMVLDSVGVSIWQMAVEPFDSCLHPHKNDSQQPANRHDVYSDCESCYTDDDNDSDEPNAIHSEHNNLRLAIACDDGCVRVYHVSDLDGLTYYRSFPRVKGRILSVAWSLDGKLLFSGSSDGIIRCWDARSFHESYRITVGLGGLGSERELCVWSLLFLRCGTLVSGDSTGSVQFWDSHHGTLLQSHTCHKGDVNALVTIPCHTGVFSAGSDGQVILYMMSNHPAKSGKDELHTEHGNKWVRIGYKRAHTHDVRALTIAVPISSEDILPDEKLPKIRRRTKPMDFSYHKWARLGVPMLMSAGDDAKLFAYPAEEFTQFEPHDICPAPQRVPVQLVCNSAIDGALMVLAQYPGHLDIALVSLIHNESPATKALCHIKAREARKLISSAIASSGTLIALSDNVRPSLFELRRKGRNNGWSLNKLQLPGGLPSAHCMVFDDDSSRLMLAGIDRKIYVVDLKKSELVHTFVSRSKEGNISNAFMEPAVTRIFTSSDGRWLVAVNCFGDIYVFNLELYRQHWFISRLNGASVTAGGFPPKACNTLVIVTSANQLYVFDVEAKQLGKGSRHHTFHLPRRFQEIPGEVIGISFPPSPNSTSAIVYSTRAMCLIDFGMQACPDDYSQVLNDSNALLGDYDAFKNIKGNQKRKIEESLPCMKSSSDFVMFRNPALLVSHISESSVYIIEKPWEEVRKAFGAPVHRHIFGT